MTRGARLRPNLGAEEGPGERPAAAAAAIQVTAHLWSLLFGPGTRLLDPVQGDAARRWPDALGPEPESPVFPWLEDTGAELPWLADDIPAVHDKAFAHRVAVREGLLPRLLAEHVTVFEPEDLAPPDRALERIRDALRGWPPAWRPRFTLKPRLGTSGRGRVAGSADALDAPALVGALPRLAERGGALLEPWLERTGDFSTQLWIAPDGGIVILGTLEQLTTPSGVVRGHRGGFDSRGRVFSECRDEEALREAAVAIAGAARDAGYRGPCGVDAFSYRDPNDENAPPERLRAVVELNARFTTGTIAVGLVKRALAVAKHSLGLEPGQRCAFQLALDAPAGGGWEAATERVGAPCHLVPLTAHPCGGAPEPALLLAPSFESILRADAA